MRDASPTGRRPTALGARPLPEHRALIRGQLDFLDIDEGRLYPDVDGIAAAFRRYYA